MFEYPKWFDDWYQNSLSLYKSKNAPKISDVTSVSDSFVNYIDLPTQLDDSLKVAQVKLNGGLGTSMGCQGPKSLIQCHSSGQTFLDFIVSAHLKNPISHELIFLNSFNTSNETRHYLNKTFPDLTWSEVIQYPFRKIDEMTEAPFKGNDSFFFNPPGHGSVYFDLYYSGILHQLKSAQVDSLFISNADNLAALCDPKIASYMKQSNCPFLIELTPKKDTDVKGGTIVRSNGRLTLWEIAQVEDNQLDLFKSQPYFNTNNIWVNVNALIDIIEANQLSMDLILNNKSKNNYSFIQMEYAMGSAIQSFHDANALIVPRQRFFPIKKTSDLLLLLSDYTELDSSGHFSWNENHIIDLMLQPPFDTVDGFFKYFKVFPSIRSLNSLALKGKIHFNCPIQFKNNVEIILSHDEEIFLSEFPDLFDNVKYINGQLISLLNKFT